MFMLSVFLWCPTTVKLTSMVERVHTKFVKKLPVSYHSKFDGTSQISYCHSDPSLH